MEKTERIFTTVNIYYHQELDGQGLVFYSRHEEKETDYEEMIDYTGDSLIFDDITEDEYTDEVDEDEDVDVDEELNSEEHLQNFYPNGTVIKFKCSQTKPTQFASWEIRFVLLTFILIKIKYTQLQIGHRDTFDHSLNCKYV